MLWYPLVRSCHSCAYDRRLIIALNGCQQSLSLCLLNGMGCLVRICLEPQNA